MFKTNTSTPFSEERKRKISEATKGRNNPMYGKHHSEETRKKISEALRGRKLSEETKEKMRNTRKIKPVWNKGLTKETSERLMKSSENHIGLHLSEETKRKISKVRKSSKCSEKTKLKISETLNGHEVSEETKRKISKTQKGEKSYNWKGGISFEPYSVDWTEILKRSIRERDHYICQLCSNYGNIVHHIDYDKKNCNPENLITLCKRCNPKVNANRDYWAKYFKSIFREEEKWGSDIMIQPKKYGINCTY